jgi:1-acyl-sn-glycerol-3-phosphate acyltransferase
MHPVQLQGNRLARWLLACWGWRVDFNGLPGLQGIFVVYPHTSNWDFVVAVMAKWSIGLQLQFWGKDSLFRFPVFGRWLRWIGGIPVDRSAPGGLVGQAIEAFSQAKSSGTYFWLGLSPEGTRKKTPGWRSGFYKTAVQANVPVCLVQLDFAQRRVDVTHFLQLSGDESVDLDTIAAFFSKVQGCNPDNASPVVLLSDRSTARSRTSF